MVCLFVCPSVCMAGCPSVGMSDCQSVRMYALPFFSDFMCITKSMYIFYHFNVDFLY